MIKIQNLEEQQQQVTTTFKMKIAKELSEHFSIFFIKLLSKCLAVN